MKKLLYFFSLVMLLPISAFSQNGPEVQTPGIIGFLSKEIRDDVFGVTYLPRQALQPGTEPVRMIFIVDPSILSLVSLKEIGDWMNNEYIKLGGSFALDKNSILFKTNTENGVVTNYISVDGSVRMFGGKATVNISYNSERGSPAWSMSGTSGISVEPKRVAVVELKVERMPVFKEIVANLNINLTGSNNATITLERVGGADVLSTDGAVVSPTLTRSLINASSLSLIGIINGTYNIKVSEPGFETVERKGFPITGTALIELPITMVQQKMQVIVTVTEKNKPATDYDILITKSSDGSTVEDRKFQTSSTVQFMLSPGDYQVRIIRGGALASALRDLNVKFVPNGPPITMSIPIVISGATTPALSGKPSTIVVSAIVKGSEKKVAGFKWKIEEIRDGKVVNEYKALTKDAAKKKTLIPGTYKIYVSRDGYYEYSSTFELRPGEENRQIIAEMEKQRKYSPAKTSGGWGFLFLVATTGAAGYYLATQSSSSSYGTPPALPTL